ncbi:carbonic anhydrase family protein [Allonocardiopsis opalescens]|nr:carbonic anhydrase family protein [Allonocardiopsis opalescens]
MTLGPSRTEPRPDRAGRRQSPIDIDPAGAQYVPSLPGIAFAFGPSALTLGTVRPATHAPGCDRDDEENIAARPSHGSATAVVTDAHRNLVYELDEVHWHAPAEHTVAGHRFPLEAHLKYHRTGEPSDAMVVAVLVEPGPAHPVLDQVIAAFPEPGEAQRHVPLFDLAALLPASRGSYRYSGSLTTCEYGEGVWWVVLAEPVTAAEAQIGAFAKRIGPNARPVQPPHERAVYTDLPPKG